jgi:hypothetical protein
VNEYAPGENRRWRILVALTGTTEGQHALEHAIGLAARSDPELLGLVIEERLPASPATRGEADDEARRHRPLFDTITSSPSPRQPSTALRCRSVVPRAARARTSA